MSEAIEFGRILSGRTHAPLVYFLRVGDRVKIGTTTNLSERVKALSLTLSEVTHVIPGDAEMERTLHERWDRYRVHANREWFHASGSLAAFLRPETLRPDKPRRKRPQRRTTLARTVIHQGAPRYTLAGASRAGIVPMRPDALRQAKRRPGFPPAGEDGMWTAQELQDWHANRASTTPAAKTG